MIGMMLIGITADPAAINARVEDLIAWVAIEGELWARYESKLAPMEWYGNDAKGSPIYSVDWEGRGIEIDHEWEFLDRKGAAGILFSGRVVPGDVGTYAIGVSWGFMVRVGPDLFMWA